MMLTGSTLDSSYMLRPSIYMLELSIDRCPHDLPSHRQPLYERVRSR